MTVKKQSVADHSRSSCEAASRRDSQLLPYGDTSSLLSHPSPAQACQVSCFTSDNVKVSTVTRGWSFPDGTVCRVEGRPENSQSFCIQVRQTIVISIQYHMGDQWYSLSFWKEWIKLWMKLNFRHSDCLSQTPVVYHNMEIIWQTNSNNISTLYRESASCSVVLLTPPTLSMMICAEKLRIT